MRTRRARSPTLLVSDDAHSDLYGALILLGETDLLSTFVQIRQRSS